MADVTRRVLAAVTTVMPPARRGWGKAMIAELDHVHSARDRARLVLGAIRVALLPPPGLAGYGRAAGRGCVVAVISWIPLSAALYLANVVFPAPQDNAFAVLLMDAYVIIALMAAGAAAQRASAGSGAPIIAGMAAGFLVAVLGMATFAVIDNVFLSVVSHQQAKIDGFRASGMTSMRVYINASLEATAPGVAIILTLGGAFLGALGASLARETGIARTRRRGHCPNRAASAASARRGGR